MAPRKQKKNVLVQRMLCSFLVILFFLSIYAKNINAFFQNIFSEYFGMQGAQVADTMKIKYTDQQKKDLISSLTAGKATLQTSIDAIKQQIYYYINTININYYPNKKPDTIVFTDALKDTFGKFENDFVDLDKQQKIFSATLDEIEGKGATSGISSVTDADISLLNTYAQSIPKAIDALKKGIDGFSLKILTLDMNPDWSTTVNSQNPRIDFHWSRSWNTMDKKILTGKFDFLVSFDAGYSYSSYPDSQNLDTAVSTYSPSGFIKNITDDTPFCFKVVIHNTKITSNFRCFQKGKNGVITLYDTPVLEYTGPIVTKTTTGVFINAPVPNFTSSKITTRSATLTWEKVDGAVGYAIYREGELIKIVKANEKLTYTEDAILMPETTYTYIIRPLSGLMDVPQTLDQSPAPISMEKPKGFFASIENFFEIKKVSAETGDTQVTVTTQALPPVATINTGHPLKILAVLVNFADTQPGESDTPESVKKKLFTNEYSVANIYNKDSFGKFTIAPLGQGGSKVVGPYTSSYKKSENPTTSFSFREKINNQVHLDKDNIGINFNDYLVIYILSKFNTHYAGHADRIGQEFIEKDATSEKGTIYINGDQDKNIFSHEIGHILGLYHASTIECPTENILYYYVSATCSVDSYGDITDVMGDGLYGVDSYRKYRMGWLQQSPINSSGGYDVVSYTKPGSFNNVIELGTNSKTNSKIIMYLSYYSIGDPTLDVNGLTAKYAFLDGLETSVLLKFKDQKDKLRMFDNGDHSFRTPYYFYSGSDKSNPLKSIRVVQLSKDVDKAKVFVRFEDDIKKINVTAVAKSDNTVDVSWIGLSVLSDKGGYHLYRDYYRDPKNPTQNPINTGDGEVRQLTFNDKNFPNDGKPHTYTVVPYDAFDPTTYPATKGVEYAMDPSADSNEVTINTPVSIQSCTIEGNKTSISPGETVKYLAPATGGSGQYKYTFNKSITGTSSDLFKNTTDLSSLVLDYTALSAGNTVTVFARDTVSNQQSALMKCPIVVPNPVTAVPTSTVCKKQPDDTYKIDLSKYNGQTPITFKTDGTINSNSYIFLLCTQKMIDMIDTCKYAGIWIERSQTLLTDPFLPNDTSPFFVTLFSGTGGSILKPHVWEKFECK